MADYSEARIFGRKILAEKKLQDVIFFSGVLVTFRDSQQSTILKTGFLG
jgi:tartrate dehydratase beta subunit/fumarate hydratase class I family protein